VLLSPCTFFIYLLLLLYDDQSKSLSLPISSSIFISVFIAGHTQRFQGVKYPMQSKAYSFVCRGATTMP